MCGALWDICIYEKDISLYVSQCVDYTANAGIMSRGEENSFNPKGGLIRTDTAVIYDIYIKQK